MVVVLLFPPRTLYADNIFEFRVPRVKFGVGSLEELPWEVKRLGGRRVFVVTSSGWVRRGLVKRLESMLEGLELDVYAEVEPEPSVACVEELAERMSSFKPDVIVAIGGGSVIDAAKAAAVVAEYGGRLLDYLPKPYGGGRPVPGPVKPIIAVPTTAGTGSEVTSVAVVTIPERGVKTALRSDYTRPVLALLDPELTLTMPPSLTAATAMDALTHAVEAYMARPYYTRPRPRTPEERPVYHGSNPLTDVMAEKAIELIGSYLRRAVYHGSTDIEARSAMLLAANMAGIAFGNAGTSLAHAASYPLGGRYHVPHGIAVGVLLPAVLEYNAPSNYCKAARIGELLSGENPPCKCCPEAGKWAADKIRELQRDIGFPSGLEELGVDRRDLPAMAREALNQRTLIQLNPRPVTYESVLWVYERAWRNY